MVFQEPMTSLSPVHTIGNQITEVITLHQNVSSEAARAKAIEMLDFVGMPLPDRTIDQYACEVLTNFLANSFWVIFSLR